MDRQIALTAWIQRVFNCATIVLSPLAGDASFRRYFRFEHQGNTFIAVDAPPATEKNVEFVALAGQLKQALLLTPTVLHHDLRQGFLCVEDLGDTLLADVLGAQNVGEWYHKACELLQRLQAWQPAVTLPCFDAAFIERENALFVEWLLKAYLDYAPSARVQQGLSADFAQLTTAIIEQPYAPMHRDFHSRNLMVQNSNKLALIDFQDMVYGPQTYDLVSLLRDCYVHWPDDQVRQWALAFKQTSPQLAVYSDVQVMRWFDLTGIQRHLKAAGIFARLYRRDGKQAYLSHIPHALKYVLAHATHYPELQCLVELLKTEVFPRLPLPLSELSTSPSATAQGKWLRSER